MLATRAIIDANYLWKDPSREPVPLPPPDSPPIPNLPLKRGLRRLECLHICCTPEGIRNHLYRAHPHLRRPRGRSSALGSQADQTQPRWEETFCQRFFVTGSQSGYFAVLPPVPDIELRSQNARPPKASNALSPEESMRAQIEKKLDYHAAATETWLQTIPNAATMSEVSPWLEMTRWPKYLGGHSFVETALLAVIPDPVQEPLLVEFTKSVERVIEAGYRSIREDKVNIFDQARINSFIQRRRACDRPLMVQLQKSTWRQYTSLWQRLICFVYRTAQPGQPIQLSHRLTNAQMAYLDRIVQYGEDALRFSTSDPDDITGPDS